MNRRGFLKSILAAGVAPAIVRAQSLMPVRTAPIYIEPAPILAPPNSLAVYWGNTIVEQYAWAQGLSNEQMNAMLVNIEQYYGIELCDQSGNGLQLTLPR